MKTRKIPYYARYAGVGLLLSAAVVQADISGKVFRDFNANGTFDTGASFNEVGAAGVTVKAFDVTGAETAVATSGADGAYTLTGLTAAADYRVEFSWAESWLKPGVAGGTSVQFVKDGATGINVALQAPDEYSSSADPRMAISTYRNGSGVGSTDGAIQSFQRSSSGLNSQFTASDGIQGTGPQPDDEATLGEVGSTWGIAWQANKKRIYAASFLKRHVGLAKGLGSVYVVDASTQPGSLVKDFNLQGITPANGGAAIDLGNVCRDSTCASEAGKTGIAADYELPASKTSPNVDMDAFYKVGKVGFGDIDMQPNSDWLWLVNANQQALISVNVGISDVAALPGEVKQYPIASLPGAPVCDGGALRPWALGFAHGKGYLGVTCDAFDSRQATDLKAIVLSFEPNNISTGFTTLLNFPLAYSRDTGKPFQPWLNETEVTTGYLSQSSTQGQVDIPQPLLSDIEFDDNGNLYLNIVDIFTHQTGSNNFKPISGGSAELINGIANGDFLKACKVPAGFVLEGHADCPVNFANGVGPHANGEFFEDSAGDGRQESASGAMAVLHGTGQIDAILMDPHPTGQVGPTWWTTQGINSYNLSDGKISNWYAIHHAGDPSLFGKGTGFGDIELLTDPAPIEVGNRVWNDTDADGIQDADEAGIDGVDVILTCGAETATATTANGGQFLFSSATNATFMGGGESCKVTVSSAGQTELDGLSVTQQNADNASDNNPVTDVRDSDANTDGEISFTVGGVGENNHALDIGYKLTPVVTLDFGDAPDSYKTLAATTGAQHTIVAGLNLGAVVDAETDGQPNAAADGDGADEDGVNFMTPLAPGKRAIIGVATTQPRTSDAKLDAWIDFNGDGDFEDAGEQIATNLNIKGITLYDQGSTVLDIEVPATAKPGVTYARFRLSSAGGFSPSGAAPDGEVEDYAITIVSGATLGNFVWQDTNKDGVQDAGEPPVAGVQVNLIRVSDGAVVDSLFTDSNGEYLFTHVAPDTYQVAFVAPTGYSFTTAMQGSDDAKDSNADVSGLTSSITLADGDDQRQWDAGLVLADNTLVYCAAVPRQPTEVNTTFTLPKFDSALGTLQTVNVSAYASTQQFVALENYAAQTQKIKITTSVDGVLTLPDANIVDTTYAYNSGFKDLTVADGILDYQGTSALAFADWQYAVDSSNVTYATPADFTTATAGETIALPYETMSGYSVTGGGGNNQSFQRTFANAGACVAYVYEKKALAVDVSLTKVANKTEVKRGDTVVYTLTVTNESDVVATGVEVTDELPAGVQYVSDDSAGAYASATGVWTVGELTAKASKTIAISVLVK